MAKSELHRDYILELENELQEFEAKADSTTKRMKMLVYPAMVAFFILSIFGFYLIYSLTSDVTRMANTIAHMSDSIDENMTSISGTMDHMSTTMDTVGSSTQEMSNNVGKMTDTTRHMSSAITGMQPAIYDMAASTNNMQRDFWSLNKNVSTPLSFMNNFLPWKDDQSMPFQGSSAPLPQSFYSYPASAPVNGGNANQIMPIPAQQGVSPGGYTEPNYNSVPVTVTPAGMVGSNDQRYFNNNSSVLLPNTASIN